MKLSIIVVNYNVKHFLAHCLNAVMQSAQDFQVEVLVVDNHSSDDSIAYLKPKFSSAIFIENKENIGFAKANNQGLAIAKGEYILYLNPDTIIAENTLKDCIKFLDKNKNASALGVQMLDGSGMFLPESKRGFPSASASFYKLSAVEKIFPKSKITGKYSLGFLDKNNVHEVDVLAGAFIMGRADLLKKINGFDERYFMYGEDIDLSFSLQKLGYKNFYLGNVSIIHFKGESTKKDNSKHRKVFYDAMKLFVEKHYSSSSKFFYSKILKLGIIGRSGISALNNIFIKEKKSNFTFDKIYFLGDKNVSEEAEKICRKNFSSAQFLYQQQINSSQKDEALIFCIGKNFSYKNAVDFLKKNAPMQNVFWFYNDADCVIGSSNKNKTGEIFS